MIILERLIFDKRGTFGILTVDDFNRFYTVERPWVDNKQFISCIPKGYYNLVPHLSSKYGHVLALENDSLGVTHWEEDIPNNRYAILIHVANYPSDVQGCIGLGTEMTDGMVLNSREAVHRFYKLVDPTEVHEMRIL